jgi:AmpD protein
MSAAGGVLRVAADGWIDGLRRIDSPNFDARPEGVPIDLLVIHNISLPPGDFGGGHVAKLFTNALPPVDHPFFEQLAGLRVSSHFLIERDGRLTQFVSCNARAWHAGLSAFKGRQRCNDFSIGIELEGTDFSGFSDAQYLALQSLLPALADHYPLTHARGHSEIASDRKTDPGPFFDWLRVPVLAALHARR